MSYVNKGALRTVYFAIFCSYVIYFPIEWGKALRIMQFAQFNSHTSPLSYNSNILKFFDIIFTGSYFFINNCFNKASFAELDGVEPPTKFSKRVTI